MSEWEALKAIKLTALSAKDAPEALAHIVRLCIAAGVAQKLPELESENAKARSAMKTEIIIKKPDSMQKYYQSGRQQREESGEMS